MTVQQLAYAALLALLLAIGFGLGQGLGTYGSYEIDADHERPPGLDTTWHGGAVLKPHHRSSGSNMHSIQRKGTCVSSAYNHQSSRDDY